MQVGKWIDRLRLLRRSWPVREFSRVDGFFTEHEATVLYELACKMPAHGVACEIGAWKGRSTYCLAKGLPDGARLIVVDPFDCTGDPDSAKVYSERADPRHLLDQFKYNMSTMDVLGRLDVKVGTSRQHQADVPSLDLLFIDGDHSVEGCSYDYMHYAPKVKSGGHLIFHDYYSGRKNLGSVVAIETLVFPSLQYEFIGCFDTLWVGRRL